MAQLSQSPKIPRARRAPWRTAVLSLAVVVMAGAVTTLALRGAEAATITPGAWYNLINVHSNKLMEVENNSTADAAMIQQYDNTGCLCQQFRFEDAGSGYWRIIARHSGKAIDLYNWNLADGAEYRQWPVTTGVNQQFSVQNIGDNIQLINRHSGKALDLWEWNTANAARISQYTDTNAANQQWKLVPAGTTTPTTPGGRTWSNTADGFAAGTTGGAGGQTVTVTTQAQLNQYVTASGSYIIRVAATINISPKGTELRVASNKTILGVGTSGQIVGGGFFLAAGVSNVIIRNLTIRDTLMPDDDPGDDAYDYDAIQIDTASRIWIDHNRLSRMNDGLLDSRKDTTKITVSWNHFDTNHKTFGIGWTDNVTAQMTVHHNWFQNTQARNPSADNLANIHLYNNYLQDTGDGHYIRGATKAVIENCYFEDAKNPYYVTDTGQLVQRGNITVNSTWSSGRVKERGSAFNPSSFYSYTLDPAANVPGLVRQYAGPQTNIGA